KGDPDAAALHYKEALRMDARYIRAHANLGSILLEKRQIEEAIRTFRTVVSLSPADAPAHLGLIAAMEAKGDRDAAAREIRAFLELQPADTKRYMGLADFLIGQKDYAGVIAVCQEWARIKPDDAEAHHRLGFAFMMTNQLQNAVGSF